MNPQILNFFRETLNRLKTKSPRFFFIMQMFAGSLTAASKLPGILERWTTLIVSPQFVNICEDVSKYAIGFLACTLLSAESKPMAMTPKGDVIKRLDEDKYPFTAKVEHQKAEKLETPVVSDPLPKTPDPPTT